MRDEALGLGGLHRTDNDMENKLETGLMWGVAKVLHNIDQGNFDVYGLSCWEVNRLLHYGRWFQARLKI